MIRTITAVTAATIAAISLPTVADAQSRSASYQMYAIIDFETDAPKRVVMDAAEQSLGRHSTDFQFNRPIAVPTPEEPGRFALVNPLQNSPLGALAALSGGMAQYQVATCEGAVWTANANRNISGSQALRVQMCLFPYANAERRGYHLNIYANDVTERGGGLSERLGRAIAQRAVGSPREWTERMLKEAVGAVSAAAAAPAILIEGEPEIEGLGIQPEA